MKRNGAKPRKPSEKTKPANTCIMVCPAIMLAKSRTERLIGRARKDTTSIGTRSGARKFGTPDGRNYLKKRCLCLMSPMTIMAGVGLGMSVIGGMQAANAAEAEGKAAQQAGRFNRQVNRNAAIVALANARRAAERGR